MGRLGSFAVALSAAGFVAASVLAAGGPAATCTAGQKTQRTKAAALYARSTAAARKRYYAAHKSPALRTRFVKQQQARLAALRAAASCTVASTTTPVTTTTAPASPSVAYRFGPGMGDGAEATIAGYLDHAATDLLPLTGVAVQATAYASTDTSWLGQMECDALGYHDQTCYTGVASQFATGFSVATGAPGGIWVDWAAAGFQSDPPALLQEILAHELFHVIQFQLGMPNDSTVPLDQPRRGGPNWLVEGAAEYIGYRVTGDVGLQDYGTSLEQQKGVAKGFSIPLDQLVTVQQSQITRIYYLFEVAVDHLVAETSVGALVDYFKELGAGMSWPDAFQLAFGRTVDQYYADFAAYRATL